MKADAPPSYPFEGLKRRHYRCIVADPPWQFKSYTALPENWRDTLKDTRAIERHYEVMDKVAIAALPVRELAHPDGAHLFLWTTGPCMPHALEVMAAWGFTFSTLAFTWVKLRRSFDVAELLDRQVYATDLHTGLGLTTRKNAEFVLLGRRGNAKRLAKDVREIILAPVREHSRKPQEMYDRVVRYCDGPRVDLFARSHRQGWTTWGDQLEKFV